MANGESDGKPVPPRLFNIADELGNPSNIQIPNDDFGTGKSCHFVERAKNEFGTYPYDAKRRAVSLPIPLAPPSRVAHCWPGVNYR